MRMNLKNLLWLLAAVICFASCSKEDIIEKVAEIPEGKILVGTEIVIDGVIQSDTRAVSEAGYTTGDGLYDKKDKVTVAAFANEGYELVTFYDKKEPNINLGASYTLTVQEPRTFKAEFARKYTITVSANPTAGGTVAGGGTYRGGKTCTLTATANAGYVFDGWYEGSTKVSSDTNYSFIVSSNRTIQGKFAAPIIITINDRERKSYYEGELCFADYIMRTIICNSHTVILQVNASVSQTGVTPWSKTFEFKTGEAEKELTRVEHENHGSGDDAWWEDVDYKFLSFSLTIDGTKVVNSEIYNQLGGTDNLYYDQVQMDGREFTVSGKSFKIKVIRDLY